VENVFLGMARLLPAKVAGALQVVNRKRPTNPNPLAYQSTVADAGDDASSRCARTSYGEAPNAGTWPGGTPGQS
jgi:hypothetical protein